MPPASNPPLPPRPIKAAPAPAYSQPAQPNYQQTGYQQPGYYLPPQPGYQQPGVGQPVQPEHKPQMPQQSAPAAKARKPANLLFGLFLVSAFPQIILCIAFLPLQYQQLFDLISVGSYYRIYLTIEVVVYIAAALVSLLIMCIFADWSFANPEDESRKTHVALVVVIGVILIVIYAYYAWGAMHGMMTIQ